MKAFLLAAGLGERLRPLTLERPKPLVKVCGIPAILYSVTLLKEAGITSVICNIHYRGKDIVEFLAENDNFGLDITYSTEETILGTGGGLMKCRDFLSDGPFVMMNSDIVTDMSLATFIPGFPAEGEGGRVILSKPAAGFPATVSVKGNRVMDFRDSLGTGIPPLYDYTGVAVLTPEIFNFLETGFSSVVYTGFTSLVCAGRLGCRVHDGMWLDIGSLESLAMTERVLCETGDELFARIGRMTGFSN